MKTEELLDIIGKHLKSNSKNLIKEIEKIQNFLDINKISIPVIKKTKRRNTEMKDKNGKFIREGDSVLITTNGFMDKQKYKVVWENYQFSLIDIWSDGDKYGPYTRRFALHGDIYEVVKD